MYRDWKESLEFKGEVEFSLDDVRNSNGINYLYYVRGSDVVTTEFLYGAPDVGGADHEYRDRLLRWPKDIVKGKLARYFFFFFCKGNQKTIYE